MKESDTIRQEDAAAVPRWYVIQCKGGESFRATENLLNQGFEVFHPVLDVQKKRRGKLTWITEPLFPYYLFIRLDRLVSNWRPIRSTRGVLKLVTFGDTPIAVDDSLVAALRDKGDERDQDANFYFQAGEAVQITEGPFKELQAVFESHKGEKRAIVLLNMLQRQQRLEMPVANLRRG
ncbi:MULTISPECIES: transcription/translation regulatory transformer protein RfaH [unclassified Halomonas]|uniref:transcription/translation regulatory transformer protein RfaH n=1 Tax=unclassified Halomonas TaxID=2609666 RepID=UPI002887C173|nr:MULTISPECIES: transcription/translation regulatory transformer protein RfaH [unclassified Halomonas]MDT0500615.1 transcription/translation regulatory transformer protein RfaH [Halomonas sp. PAR7]MDT0511489.1 transcription/translation regulatory transformer protein RfaH [Halomonas sp. LES1]MDT0590223.1 transcription/translation regulatory transformer protein RfaH [Halomonas sp. PAR8]